MKHFMKIYELCLSFFSKYIFKSNIITKELLKTLLFVKICKYVLIFILFYWGDRIKRNLEHFMYTFILTKEF